MKYWLFPILFVMLSGSAYADDVVVERIRAAMNRVLPEQQPDAIRPSPIGDLYEVSYGPRLYYVSADGKYLLNGDMFDLIKETNISEERRGAARLKVINALGEKAMIIYPAKGKVKHTVTVFTDIDCYYCRKLHEGMKEMNDLGITVRYLAYPRAGIPSVSYDKAVSVWCAADRNKALDMAKLEDKVTPESCKGNPVREERELGDLVGVTATPSLVLEDGTLVPGYMPPQRLAKLLDEHESRKN